MEYNFEFVHRAGFRHQAADELSNLRTNSSDRTLLEDYIPAIVINRSNKQAMSSSKGYTADGSHAKVSSAFPKDPQNFLKFIESQ